MLNRLSSASIQLPASHPPRSLNQGFATHPLPSALFPCDRQGSPLPGPGILDCSPREDFVTSDTAGMMRSDVCIPRHGREGTSHVLVCSTNVRTCLKGLQAQE